MAASERPATTRMITVDVVFMNTLLRADIRANSLGQYIPASDEREQGRAAKLSPEVVENRSSKTAQPSARMFSWRSLSLCEKLRFLSETHARCRRHTGRQPAKTACRSRCQPPHHGARHRGALFCDVLAGGGETPRVGDRIEHFQRPLHQPLAGRRRDR